MGGSQEVCESLKLIKKSVCVDMQCDIMMKNTGFGAVNLGTNPGFTLY